MVVLFNPTVYSQLLDFQLTNNRVTLHVMKMSTSCEDWRYVCAEVRGEKVNQAVKMTVPEYTKELFRQQWNVFTESEQYKNGLQLQCIVRNVDTLKFIFTFIYTSSIKEMTLLSIELKFSIRIQRLATKHCCRDRRNIGMLCVYLQVTGWDNLHQYTMSLY